MKTPSTLSKTTSKKKINVALQGGGAHGAFTWGVLDYLLEDNRLDFEAVSATSAGSMNAVVMVHGLMEGGAIGARKNLEMFWHKVSNAGAVFCPTQNTKSTPSLMNFMPMWSGAESFMNAIAQSYSPYQFNPLNYNPLSDILDEMVDFKSVQKNEDIKLFITATNVRTGDAQIFKTEELTRDMVLASAALPNIFQAVTVDGEFYWDGGYMGNPSLWPLCYEVEAHDLLIVMVNSLVRDDLPKEAATISDRLNEITFNGAMLKELRAISFVQKLIRRDMLKDEYKEKYREILIHAIRADDVMRDFGWKSKLDTSWPFLCHLRDEGRKAARKWCKNNFEMIGAKSTVDIDRDFLNAEKKLEEIGQHSHGA